jgi:hypothetical protein
MTSYLFLYIYLTNYILFSFLEPKEGGAHTPKTKTTKPIEEVSNGKWRIF